MAMRTPAPQDLLFDPELCCEFEPFQAITILELLANNLSIRNTQFGWNDIEQSVQFRANVSLAFPPSLIAQIIPPLDGPPDPSSGITLAAQRIRERYKRDSVPTMIINFFGLFGPQGALPLTYTQTLCELDTLPNVRKTSTRTALRDWLDVFNNRMTILLYRAWQKYRMPVGYLRSAWRRLPSDPVDTPDRISQAMLSIIGLGTPPLRNRLRVLGPGAADEYTIEEQSAEPLTRIEDRALLAYAGAFARQRAGAHELRAMLVDYFDLPITVQTLTGQWLDLPLSAQTKLDESESAGKLGVNAVAGEKIWDSGSKFRLRIGPLRYRDFVGYLPDPTPLPERKSIYLLSQLTRLYVGAELDFEIQLVIHNFEVPDCLIQDVSEGGLGLRLGWNTWLKSDSMPDEVDDVRFDSPCEVVLPTVQA